MLIRSLTALVLLIASGCQNPLLRSQSPEKEAPAEDEFKSKVETRLLGDYMSVHGNTPIVLQGIGLVTGLDGTGGDPPPSVSRTELRDEMSRRGVQNPEAVLRRPSTALVVVRAYLPPLAHKGQTIDVEVRLPPNSNATSLRGGWLMETRLTEQQATNGRVLSGKEYAVAMGPILVTGSGDEATSDVAQLKRGIVLAGGRSLADRDLTVVLRNDFRSVRNSRRISNRIGERFHHYNSYGNREPLAKGLTDQQIELKLHPRYRDNDWRYKQVIRHISFRESPVAARLRLQQLHKDMMDPGRAAKAALQLEAIGRDSIPFLKKALNADALETRFHAAVALAYLDDPAGVPALAEAARDEPAFRAHAFAALAVIRETEAMLALRELMNGRSAETRYGAFRSLTVLDPADPFLATEQFPFGFTFHEIDATGDPMIHITHRRKPEVVVFGKGQKFKTPLALQAGRHVMIRARDDADEIVISRYQLGKPDVREVVSASIPEVIRKAVELGATYPDIAEMLMQARRQHNLPGRLEIDALPKASNTFARVGKVAAATADTEEDNLEAFSAVRVTNSDDNRGRATAVDARRESAAEQTRPTFRQRLARFFRRSE